MEKAKLKAKLEEVDHIAESHQQFKSKKAILSQQLKDAEMALKLQKDREGRIAKHHTQQVRTILDMVHDLNFGQNLSCLRLRRLLHYRC